MEIDSFLFSVLSCVSLCLLPLAYLFPPLDGAQIHIFQYFLSVPILCVDILLAAYPVSFGSFFYITVCFVTLCTVVGIIELVHVTSASNFPMLTIGVPIVVTGLSPFFNLIGEHLSL